MCEPTAVLIGTAVLSTGVTVASQVMQHKAQNQADAQNDAAAKEAEKLDLQNLAIRAGQEKEAAAGSILEIDREARIVDAQARVAAGEAGVAGASVDALLADVAGQGARAKLTTERNLDDTLHQMEREKLSIRANSKSRQNATVAANPWATGLSIAGTLAGGAGDVVRALPKRGGN